MNKKQILAVMFISVILVSPLVLADDEWEWLTEWYSDYFHDAAAILLMFVVTFALYYTVSKRITGDSDAGIGENKEALIIALALSAATTYYVRSNFGLWALWTALFGGGTIFLGFLFVIFIVFVFGAKAVSGIWSHGAKASAEIHEATSKHWEAKEKHTQARIEHDNKAIKSHSKHLRKFFKTGDKFVSQHNPSKFFAYLRDKGMDQINNLEKTIDACKDEQKQFKRYVNNLKKQYDAFKEAEGDDKKFEIRSQKSLSKFGHYKKVDNKRKHIRKYTEDQIRKMHTASKEILDEEKAIHKEFENVEYMEKVLDNIRSEIDKAIKSGVGREAIKHFEQAAHWYKRFEGYRNRISKIDHYLHRINKKKDKLSRAISKEEDKKDNVITGISKAVGETKEQITKQIKKGK